ncbi:alpha/beta hydrolase [Rhodanobacter sp. Soil772]|uniref:alpha/beta fold hydrolase n=1 Tax=Rhodanobacter sp. Soil772 TaxID=1736406 RepID=UPI000AA2F11D|nr:alpha/beta hydrolase [Rhodanobacter sp. Soil772]
MAASMQSTHPTTAPTNGSTRTVQHRTVTTDGLEIFYREAGPADAPLLVLLHGFPAASHQYATLIDRLSDRFHLLAPDYPGFGYSSAPASSNAGGSFAYTFDHLADITEHWLRHLGATRFFMYVFDFGAPVGYRIASRHPDWIQGVIAQNGNAYEAGLGPSMQPAVKYWADRAGMEANVRGALTIAATRAQHVDGAADPQRINPDSWLLDQHWLDQPGRAQVMLDLLYDYQSNVALYPTWQRWLRERQPPLLLPWGRNDAFFPEAGARAYLADVPGAELHLLDGGHFILDEYLDTVADLIRDFITRHATTAKAR